jgi:hypothetical protein
MLHRAVFKLMVAQCGCDATSAQYGCDATSAQFGCDATSAQFGCDATSHHIFSWKLTFMN